MKKLAFIISILLLLSCNQSAPKMGDVGFTLMDDVSEMVSDSALQEMNLELNYSYSSAKSVERLVIHCTAKDIRHPFTRESLVEFFLTPEIMGGRGWDRPGYQYWVDREGILWQLNAQWDWDPVIDPWEVTYGVKGYNSTSLHISWEGGAYKGKWTDNRTEAQKITLRNFVEIFKDAYPDADVVGHRDMPNVTKSCPLFDVKEEYKDLL